MNKQEERRQTGPARRVDEAQEKAESWRQICMSTHIGVHQNPAIPMDVDPLTAEQMYHAWVLEYYNRLKRYTEKIADEDVKDLWENHRVQIQTRRGRNHIEIQISEEKARELAEAAGTQLKGEPPYTIKRESIELRNLERLREIQTETLIEKGSPKNPSYTKRELRPDWLTKNVLYQIHDRLDEIANDIGFAASVEEPLVTDKI